MQEIDHPEYDVHPTPPTSTSPPPFKASDFAHDGKRHLLLAASGSVATIKIPNILAALSHHSNLSIRVILTKPATTFLGGQSAEQPHVNTLQSSTRNLDGVFLDGDDEEWRRPWRRGDAILHIELRRWAHLLVIAPLSANTLAKIAGGFSDNLLTSVVRAWDTLGVLGEGGLEGRKRIVVAPAMNTAMWRHPITKRHIAVLQDEWGVHDETKGLEADEGWFEVVLPQEKELACGDVGDGAMREWKEIVEIIETRLRLST